MSNEILEDIVTGAKIYDKVLGDMKNNSGAVLKETNLQLAIKVYQNTSEYDSMITGYLKEQTNK